MFCDWQVQGYSRYGAHLQLINGVGKQELIPFTKRFIYLVGLASYLPLKEIYILPGFTILVMGDTLISKHANSDIFMHN